MVEDNKEPQLTGAQDEVPRDNARADFAENSPHADVPLGLHREDTIDQSSENEASGEPRVEDLLRKLAEAEKRVLMAEAEKDNFRKRVKQDYEIQLRYANLSMMQDLLPVRDNLERALSAAADSGESAGLREGVAMVAKLLADTLAKYHCVPIAALGEVFDPNYHEAIQQTPSQQYPAGSVALEVTTGYRLHERVVRPSQVIVSTGPAPEESN